MISNEPLFMFFGIFTKMITKLNHYYILVVSYLNLNINGWW